MGEVPPRRFGKSMLMREMAKRFPGQVVHVTPDSIDKRKREPMVGDVVVDEDMPDPRRVEPAARDA